ncbi:hypothetical protein AL346_08140 [Chelatococcus sp. CO-6]|nr:hypothetical protein AL346_08140 [Chelatococcus sp. CO-6]
MAGTSPAMTRGTGCARRIHATHKPAIRVFHGLRFSRMPATERVRGAAGRAPPLTSPSRPAPSRTGAAWR